MKAIFAASPQACLRFQPASAQAPGGQKRASSH